jgi:hypothetical protein
VILSVRIWWAQLRVDWLRAKADLYRHLSYELAVHASTANLAFGWAHANLMCLLNRKKN